MSITIRKSMNIHIIVQVIGINALTLGLRQARFVGRLGETKEWLQQQEDVQESLIQQGGRHRRSNSLRVDFTDAKASH